MLLITNVEWTLKQAKTIRKEVYNISYKIRFIFDSQS